MNESKCLWQLWFPKYLITVKGIPFLYSSSCLEQKYNWRKFRQNFIYKPMHIVSRRNIYRFERYPTTGLPTIWTRAFDPSSQPTLLFSLIARIGICRTWKQSVKYRRLLFKGFTLQDSFKESKCGFALFTTVYVYWFIRSN